MYCRVMWVNLSVLLLGAVLEQLDINQSNFYYFKISYLIHGTYILIGMH